MKRNGVVSRVAVVLGVCCLALVSPRGQAAFPPPDPAVAQMVAEVAKDRLAETIAALTSVRTRFSPTSGCRLAGTSIYNYLSRLGLAVEYDTFRYNSPRVAGGGAGRNVVATIPGTAVPEGVLVVGAHYDSFSNNEFRLAPGADDNASGTAAVLEIARVLSRHRFARTIRFITFDAEELGAHGSAHAAGVARGRRETIAAMLNLDMVGFSNAGKRALAVVPDRGNQWLADRFVQAISRYGVLIRVVKRVNVNWARGDQASFWAAGYPALDIVEDEPDNNPHYHHTSDTAETLDMDFVTAVTRATVAALADLAQLPAESQPACSDLGVTVRRQMGWRSSSCPTVRVPQAPWISGSWIRSSPSTVAATHHPVDRRQAGAEDRHEVSFLFGRIGLWAGPRAALDRNVP